MSYAVIIKRLREKMFLTQREFAEKLGVSFETINRWENGKFNPSMKEKKKLSALCEQYNLVFTEDFSDAR